MNLISPKTKEKLKTTIEFAKVDYRDLLVSAGFGNSMTIHNEWASKVLNEKTSALSHSLFYAPYANRNIFN